MSTWNTYSYYISGNGLSYTVDAYTSGLLIADFGLCNYSITTNTENSNGYLKIYMGITGFEITTTESVEFTQSQLTDYINFLNDLNESWLLEE